jgi:DNA-binding FadR family transcriptional regulator
MVMDSKPGGDSSQMGDSFPAQPIVSGGSLTDRVTEALMNKIQGEELAPGSQLPSEQVMATRFGVSRTVIREAISRLKSEGLVDTRQGRGAFVRAGSTDVPFRIDFDIRDPLQSLLYILEMRESLDSEIAFLAAERRSRDQMAEIKRALAEIERATRSGRDGVAEDVKFHWSIARATGNPFFAELIQFLSRFLSRATLVTRSNEGRRDALAQQTRLEHESIVQAIERRDPKAASVAARTHMINAASRIKSADTDFWASEAGQVARDLSTTRIVSGSKRSRTPKP